MAEPFKTATMNEWTAEEKNFSGWSLTAKRHKKISNRWLWKSNGKSFQTSLEANKTKIRHCFGRSRSVVDSKNRNQSLQRFWLAVENRNYRKMGSCFFAAVGGQKRAASAF